LGEQHPNALNSANYLAELHVMRGRYSEASPLRRGRKAAASRGGTSGYAGLDQQRGSIVLRPGQIMRRLSCSLLESWRPGVAF
jgi:hypothetical protein